MAVLSRPYSDSGVVAADVFASFTEHTHNSRLLLLNGVKVCGVWYIDSMNALRSGYGPSVMMDDVGHPYGLLLSASTDPSWSLSEHAGDDRRHLGRIPQRNTGAHHHHLASPSAKLYSQGA